MPSPINVGPQAQTKQGDLTLAGVLKVEGNLLDKLGNVIYNVLTGKIERARLPFEQGDITSDVDTNTYDAGYFDVSNLIPANIKKGLAFGRNSTGTAEVFQTGDVGAYGLLSWVWVSNTSCNVVQCNQSWKIYKSWAVSPNWIYNTKDPRGLLGFQAASQTDCWQGGAWWGGYTPCYNWPLPQSWTITCATGWIKETAWAPMYVGSPCTNGQGCDSAYCLYP